MFDPDTVAAIDIHTHAEEPCGTHADDGYGEFQTGMQKYFRTGRDWPPAIPETAAYFRERNIGAVIFAVDCERETGFRRYNNEEIAEEAAKHSDILIPFASIDPAKGKMGAREARRLVEHFGMRGSNPDFPLRSWSARRCRTGRAGKPRRAMRGHRASGLTHPAGSTAPPFGSRPDSILGTPARGVAGLDRSPRYALRPAPGGSDVWTRRRP